MDVQFVKLSPTQNMTILVESPVERARQAEAAAALMAYESVYAEQVGFIEPPESAGAWARLQMAGGEFCGNATMSLAAWLVWKKGEARGNAEVRVPLEVSGAEGIVECVIRPAGNDFLGTVRMPLPENMGEIDLPGGRFAAVEMPGITHVIVPAGALGNDPRAEASRLVPIWSGAIDAPAFGIVLYDEKTCRIDPLVCVKELGSVVWERGCGSGSAALGAFEAARTGKDSLLRVAQPGGVIEVKSLYGAGAVRDIFITGKVALAARGTAFWH
ncbi:MAG: hypothetical protein LBL51_02810 [Synergistaceae bacterium]|jgi:diaminopimelate epimerase|nr:hypothetical protein [Synergistaceae bacterium]